MLGNATVMLQDDGAVGLGMLRNVGYCFRMGDTGIPDQSRITSVFKACAALQVCKLEILFTLLNNYVWVSAV
jgi:hypothetical protein